MQLYYETDRLVTKIESSDITEKVLDFFLRNKAFFAPSEPPHVPNFYTEDVLRRALDTEYHRMLHLQSFRFWLYKKDDLNQIIGTVSFTGLRPVPYSHCEIGYRLDEAHTGQGYATEVLEYLIPIVQKDLHLHRMLAYIRPENTASIHLIERLGFTREGLCHANLLIDGSWQDHYLYAKIFPTLGTAPNACPPNKSHSS